MIGNKIKELRIKKKMTQAELAGDFITRNMLSQIENGLATPSLATLEMLASRLETPIEYFVSKSDDLEFFERKEHSERLHSAFKNGEYEECLAILSSPTDDEGRMIYALCCFELGKAALKKGLLFSAQAHFRLCSEYASASVFAQRVYEKSEKYVNLIDGILGRSDVGESTFDELDYIPQILGKPSFAELHFDARRLIAEKNYEKALKKLVSLLPKAAALGAICEYYVVADMELCLKNTSDFKQAYACAERKAALVEKMNK